MANIYRCYLNNSVDGIDWNTAVVFFEILDRILLQDLWDLEKVVKNGAGKDNFNDHAGLLRLSACGLLQYSNGEGYVDDKVKLARLTSQGKLFYRVIKNGKAI